MKDLLIQILKNNKDKIPLFLDSDIDYLTKMFVVTKILDTNQAVKFAILCAYSVSDIFQPKDSSENKLKKSLEYLKNINDFNNLNENEQEIIRQITTTLSSEYAYSAANSPASVSFAANAASFAASSAYAAAMNSKWASYSGNAYYTATAAMSANNTEKQKKINIEILKEVIKK